MVYSSQMFCLSFLAILLLVAAKTLADNSEPVAQPRLHLKGVYSLYPPYAYKKKGEIVGFALDLIEAIGAKAGFDYSLHLNPEPMKEYIGLINEVNKTNADFAIGNLDDRDANKPYADFTDPIFRDYHLSALVSKKTNSEDYCMMNDLEDHYLKGGSKFQYGIWTIDGFRFLRLIHNATHPMIVAINDSITEHLNLEIDIDVAVENVIKDQSYVLIVQRFVGQFISGDYCDVVSLPDYLRLMPRYIVIALPKGSPHKDMFNSAIKALKEEGKIEELRNKYIGEKCPLRLCSLGFVDNPVDY